LAARAVDDFINQQKMIKEAQVWQVLSELKS